MSTIAQNLEALQKAKNDIAQSILDKGGTVESGDGFSSFAESISDIEIGTDVEDTTATASDVLSGEYFYNSEGVKTQGTIQTYSGPTIIRQDSVLSTQGKYLDSNIVVYEVDGNDVTFYDYDGSIVVAYSAEDFLQLENMPANPTHEGLVSEGWNWTLSDSKEYVRNHRILNIGQNYHTESGKTEYKIEINDTTGFQFTLNNNSEKDWGDGTINTDTTHTYSISGKYTIKLSGTNLPNQEVNRQLRAVHIASGITTIPLQCFQHCYNLTYITLPNTINSINAQAFSYCFSLESIVIPSGIREISAFSNCYNLSSIIFPNGVTNLGSFSFEKCESLKIVTLPDSIITIETGAFRSCRNLVYISIPTGLHSLRSQAFSGCHKLVNLQLPEDLIILDAEAFSQCVSLTSINIPDNDMITVIKNSTFSECRSITEITIPSNITRIEDYAFSQCFNLTSIKFALEDNKLTFIGTMAFYNCCQLNSITLPSLVSEISNAFSSCNSLKSVTVLATNPPTISINTFPSTVEKFYIPNGTLDAYQNAPWWSSYSDKFVELPE